MKTKIVKRFGDWVVQFTQGVQTFHIPNLEKTKEHANWQKEMLDKAFENFKAELLLESQPKPAVEQPEPIQLRDELIAFCCACNIELPRDKDYIDLVDGYLKTRL